MSGSELRSFNRVTVHEEIGRGGYGVVYRVTLEDADVAQKETAGNGFAKIFLTTVKRLMSSAKSASF